MDYTYRSATAMSYVAKITFVFREREGRSSQQTSSSGKLGFGTNSNSKSRASQLPVENQALDDGS